MACNALTSRKTEGAVVGQQQYYMKTLETPPQTSATQGELCYGYTGK